MKKIICLLALAGIFACQEKAAVKEKNVTVSGVKGGEDSSEVATPKTGTDEDLHGCKASAGYTWSELQHDCVRVFEKGERLDAVDNPDNSIMPAFVIFKGNKAEIFISTEKAPIVLERDAPGLPYLKDDWELSSTKIPHLKKSGKLLYSGAG